MISGLITAGAAAFSAVFYTALNSTAILLGAMADVMVGDPENLPHPVQFMGRWISFIENIFLGKKEGHYAKGGPVRSNTDEARHNRELMGGIILAISLFALTWLIAGGLLSLAARISFLLHFLLVGFMSWQILAAGSMAKEARRIAERLMAGDLSGARNSLSRIVGRDTKELTEEQIVKATVESVAESTSDGIINPLFFLVIFGPVGGFIYKAANTMDSMVGYHNERYEYFGKAGAKLDDVMGYLPARLAGFFMLVAGKIAGFTNKAWDIMVNQWNRFRNLPLSPNAGQTEAAMAVGLGIELGGHAVYAGNTVERSRLGTPDRPAETADIYRSISLMFMTAALCLVFLLGSKLLLSVLMTELSVLF